MSCTAKFFDGNTSFSLNHQNFDTVDTIKSVLQ